VFEICLGRCGFKWKFRHHCVKLRYKVFGWVDSRLWIVLLFYLIDHSCHDCADWASLGIHFAGDSIKKFKIPLLMLVIKRLHLILLDQILKVLSALSMRLLPIGQSFAWGWSGWCRWGASGLWTRLIAALGLWLGESFLSSSQFCLFSSLLFQRISFLNGFNFSMS
jgi:hypothetical protein